MGIAIRFVLYSALNHEICGDDTCHIRDANGKVCLLLLCCFYCYIDDRNRHDEESCNVASALLQFFEMASEMWFLCLSVDIFISVTNPLASFKKRYFQFICVVVSLC